MEFVVYLIGLVVVGLIVGALGRLALPGPDPMSLGMTIMIGIGAGLAAGITMAIITGGERNYGGLLLSTLFAALFVYLVRRSRGGSLTDPGIDYRR